MKKDAPCTSKDEGRHGRGEWEVRDDVGMGIEESRVRSHLLVSHAITIAYPVGLLGRVNTLDSSKSSYNMLLEMLIDLQALPMSPFSHPASSPST
jgi:hypothetical protein